MEKYTKNGRNMESMNRYDIIDYLGMDEKNDIPDNKWDEIIEQAETIEKVYHNKNIDYCLKGDYELYIQEYTDIVIANTKDLIIFIKQ